MFDTLIRQWRTGGNAELKFFCDRGFLSMSFDADLGPWRPVSDEVLPKFGDCAKPHITPSPSRLRRKARRAAERVRSAAIGAAAVNAVSVSFAAAKAAVVEVPSAEKADADAIATGKAAVDVAATVKVAGEVLTAEKAAGAVSTVEKAVDELVAAENAADGPAVEKTATEVTVVVKAAGEESDAAKQADSYVSVVKAAAAEIASTSSCGKEKRTAKTCWDCDQELTVDHQCEVPPVRSRPWPSPPSSTSDAVAPQGSRSLNIKKFCVKCEERHPVGRKCQCQSAEEALQGSSVKPRVKCCVCKVLGRETTVLIGSRCQSCGVTAS